MTPPPAARAPLLRGIREGEETHESVQAAARASLHPCRRLGVGLAAALEQGSQPLADALHALDAGLLGRARIEGRLRIVFEHELDRLGDLFARQLGGDGEAELVAGGVVAAA